MNGQLISITTGVLMKRIKAVLIALFIGIIAFSSPVYAYEVIDQEKLVEAIGRAENSVKYPYGIKSINTHGDKALARKICLNTINNNLARWQWARQNGDNRDFIEFLGARFCPVNSPDDNGTNQFWVKNVKKFYFE